MFNSLDSPPGGGYAGSGDSSGTGVGWVVDFFAGILTGLMWAFMLLGVVFPSAPLGLAFIVGCGFTFWQNGRESRWLLRWITWIPFWLWMFALWMFQ